MPPSKLVPARRPSRDARVKGADGGTDSRPGRRPDAGRYEARKEGRYEGRTAGAGGRTAGKTPDRGRTAATRKAAPGAPAARAPSARNAPSARSTSNHTAAARPAPGSAPADAAIPAEGERLNKYLARTGVCSRREADDWIARGWVHINGKPVVMGQKVLPGDAVEVRRAATQQQAERVTILLNKPVGYVSGQAEDGYRPAVMLIQPENHWKGDTSRRRFDRSQLRGLAAAGRLDIDSVGLLVLTQDGRVARQLIGEDSDTTKEYLVRVRYGRIEQDVEAAFPREKLQLLRHGLSLDGRALKPAQVSWQNPEQLRFVLQEGKHRQIRRMCELVGLTVTGLKRIRMGQVTLGHLPPGQWRYLGEHERF